MDFKTLLVLACVAAGSLAGPVRERQCATQCDSEVEDGNSIFRAFKSYYYNYDVTIDSRIDGEGGNQNSRVRLQALAAIEGLSACEMVLKFSGVSLTELRQDGSMVAPQTASTFSEGLEAHPLRFSMESNGTITSVCPEAGEEIWTLNIKRGFLSAIQTKTTSQNEVMGQAGLWETAVTGTCMPTYEMDGDIITKTQDYLMCKDRTNLNMFVDAIPVHMMAPTASPMSSRLECRYERDAQGLNAVSCTENHMLKPFAQSDSQPLTSVSTRISRTSITHRIQSSLGSEFARQTCLRYEDPQDQSLVESTDVLDTLLRICDSLTDGVGSETPVLFDSLTKQLGQMDTDNMNTVIHRLFRICPKASAAIRKDVMNMVKDALIDCNSEQCAQGFFTIMQTQNSAENRFYLEKWFMKLIFVKNPTRNMILLAHRLVRGPSMNMKGYYALSSMIHRYCLINDEDCSSDEDILAAAAIFEENLQDACFPENEEETKKMLVSLRAIGNMGLIQDKPLIYRCNRERNAYAIRIASIDAHRRLPCDRVPIDRFMRTFSTTDNDSELRIAAYRAMIRCPTAELLEAIANTMATEPTHQVTCYVSSHLSNLANTQNPLLRDIQEVIRESSLVNISKCHMDIRKFSHNFAFSRYDDESGNGINVDSDVIFSSKSYLPRSLRVGMNVDLFGYGLDLFEFEARTEGMQELFESMTEEDEEDRTSNMLERVRRMMNKRLYRQKRSGVKTSSINKIKTKYLQNNDEPEDRQEAAVSMRIMNNEVFYKDQEDFKQLAQKFGRESIMMIIAALTQQRTYQYTLNKNFKPSRATIPTIAGMPLEVNIQGAFTSILKASGKLDVMGMAVKPMRMAVVGSLEPSAAIEIHSSMMVNAHCSRSGLSHKTNMAASLSMGGSLTFENGMLKVQVNAPERRQTLINASSSLFFMQGRDLVPVSEPEDTINTINRTFEDPRYQLHISGSRPNTPFSLPEALFRTWRLELTLDKLEESLTTYDLEVGYKKEKAFRNGAIQVVDQVHLLVGAPGSETIGTYLMDLTYHRSNTTLIIHTASQLYDTYFTASLRDEVNHKNLRLQVAHNGAPYFLQVGLDTVPLVDGFKFVPVFNLTVSDLESYVLEGHLTNCESGKAVDLSLMNRDRVKLIAVKGDLINNDTVKLLTMSNTLGMFNAEFQGGYQIARSEDSLSVTPIFSVSTTLPAFLSLRLGSGPMVLTDTTFTATGVSLTTVTSTLVQLDDVHLDWMENSYRISGMVRETIPFGIDVALSASELNGSPVHTLDLTSTNILGVYHVRGSLTNQSADHLYTLNVTTDVNDIDYFSLTVNFKNEPEHDGWSWDRYLETILRFRGQQVFRSKNGLQMFPIYAKRQYNPIFLLETSSLGSYSLSGSVEELWGTWIHFTDLTLTGSEDLFSIDGHFNVDRESNGADWSLTLGGAYLDNTISGAAAHRENTITFKNEMVANDGTDSPPTYSLTLDMQNSTSEGQIFAWSSKVEVDISRHPELSFRADSTYDLSPGRSTGNVFRLCYDGTDCTITDKRITLGHDLTFNHNKELGTFNNDLQVTYTHPAENKAYTLSLITDCGSNLPSGSQLIVQDGSAVIFNASVVSRPETAINNGFVEMNLEIPELYSYGSRDTWSYNPNNIFWLSEYRSGEKEMSFELQFNMTRDPEIESIMAYDFIVKYTDIRSDVFTFHDHNSMTGPGNSVRVMTLKENDNLKMFTYQGSKLLLSANRIYSSTVYVAKTMFNPIQDISFNTTYDMDLANKNNANLQAQLRFIPGQKPITLMADFNNKTTDSKKEGELTTTLSLPTLSITVFSGGKLENGVPSGNLSIKFLPLMAQSTSFGVDLVMNNKSTADSHSYETLVLLKAPDHESYIKHTLSSNKAFILPLSSNITGAWNGEEVSASMSSSLDEDIETRLALSIPDHEYTLTHSMPVTFNAHTVVVEKDSEPLLQYSTSLNEETSAAGVTYVFQKSINLMGHVVEASVTLANLTSSYSWNVQIQDNSREALYLDLTVDRYPGQRKFEVTSVTRSAFLPNYNTNVKLSCEKTETAMAVNTSLAVDNTGVFTFSFVNQPSADARITRIIVTQPTNPDLRLRQFVLEDSCRRRVGVYHHNTTVMWGNFLQTQMIGLRVVASQNEGDREVTMLMLNPGRVLGFGNQFMVSMGVAEDGFNKTTMFSMYGENGNIVTIETDYKNSSLDFMKNHCVNVTLTRANMEPISVLASLVHNDGNLVLNGSLTISYNPEVNHKLTAGVEVTSIGDGHLTILKLKHLINQIDALVMGTYSNTRGRFDMTLENNILLGDERYQPEISCSLDRNANQIDLSFTGSGSYQFHGQFTNRSNERGLIYQVNCHNIYNGRRVPYELLFDQQDRMVSMRVNYNPDNENDIWEFSSGYFNNTAIYAQLDTMHSGQFIRNGSIVLSLTDPQVVTSHIQWEPSWPEDLQAFVLDRVDKMKLQSATQGLAVSEKWSRLAARICATRTNFLMSNMAMVTNAVMLKTQLQTQWALNEPMRLVQLANIMMKWTHFNQTLHDNLPSIWAEMMTRRQLFQAEFEDIADHFKANFPLYAQDVNRTWELFLVSGQAVPAGFDPEALTDHFVATSEAQNVFFSALFSQLMEDMISMEPNSTRFAARFGAIAEDLRMVGERIDREFRTRIGSLATEKMELAMKATQIYMDIMAFNSTLQDAVASWREAIQREVEPFRHPDFSQLVAIHQKLNETMQTILGQLKTQMWGVAAQFMTPYITQYRTRRQAPEETNTMSLAAIQAAMAAFNSKYSIPSYSPSLPVEVPSVDLPVAVATISMVPRIPVAVTEALEKIFNGTYELTKFDLMNGEIIFKIFIKKDWSDIPSLANLTDIIMDKLPENATDFTFIRKLKEAIAMFDREGVLTQYQQRFQEQFTRNLTQYREIMERLQSSIQSGVQEAVETRLRPYLEHLGDRVRQRSRPFFGSEVAPVIADQHSFLQELASQVDVSGLQRMFGRAKQTMCGTYNKITSTALGVYMSACPTTWIPPYRANALVIGAKHYMTFDQQFYDFSGKCGYLLAKDFVHENDFSAIVDYEREMEVPIRNMMFMINSTTFEIKSDGSVLVDRQLRELPLQVGETAVLRIGDSIFLKNAHGVSVVCKLPHDVCVMMLSGRYFARTGGLLGNFNFEPFDDFKTPDNELQTNITSFSESWKVGKNCLQSEPSSLDLNRVNPDMDSIVDFDPLLPANQRCASMFLDNCSPMARCYSAVDPDAFYRMCVMDTRSLSGKEQSSKICSIAAAYKTQCWHSRSPVSMPDSCITCDIGDETFDAKKPVRIENEEVPRQADVVIVVEEKSCAEPIAPRLDDIVTRLAGELKENGFNDTQFGLAAFGGAGVHDVPHQHTINHKIFNHRANEFVLGRDSLEFNDEGSNDTFAAISLAANYPFRAGVSKHIILLSCSECMREDTRMQYSDLSVLLNKRGIKFTLLTNFQFNLKKEMSKAKSKSERVFGIDSTSVFTSKMAGQEIVKGDRTLREFVNEPANLCSLLAQETNGAIFDSSLMGNKGFNEVFVKRIVKNSEPSPCQVCRCVHDELVGVGRSVCEKCMDPSNPLEHDIRGAVRDFELTYNLPHMRFRDQIAEDEEEE